MVKKIIQGIIINIAGVWVCTQLLTGFNVAPYLATFLVAGSVLMLVDFVVKPILNIISFPINIVTLGFFSFFVYIFLLYLTIIVVNGITVSAGLLSFNSLGPLALTFPEIELTKFFTIVTATIIISLVNGILRKLVF